MKTELERAGRDPDDLVVSMLWGFLTVDSTQHLVDLLGEYQRAGLHHVIGVPSTRPDAGPVRSTHDLLAATLDDLAHVASDVMPAVR